MGVFVRPELSRGLLRWARRETEGAEGGPQPCAPDQVRRHAGGPGTGHVQGRHSGEVMFYLFVCFDFNCGNYILMEF